MSDKRILLGNDTPFSAEQQKQLNAVLATLTDPQAAWLSGYLARAGGLVAAAPAAAASGKTPLTILFGSESGNAETCADQAKRVAAGAGFDPRVVDMGDYDTARLASEKNLLVIVSTWGEGDPPERATGFHDFLMGDQAPKLKDTRFTVFALGDVSYAEFCECGKRFDVRLAELGASRVFDRFDADVDYEEPFNKWLQEAIPALAKAAGTGKPGAPSVETVSAPAPAAPAEPYGKKNPFPAEIKAMVNLNGRTSAKETCHLELSLEGSGLDYVPGDVAGVFPVNCPEVIDDLLQVTGFKGDEPVVDRKGDPSTLRDALAHDFDITGVNLPIIKKYAALAGNKALSAVLEKDDKPAIREWVYGREIRDLVLEYPPSGPVSAEDFTGILRKMPPRLYSIASSLRAHPDEVHLTVGTVEYESHGRHRKGVCSTYLCQRVKPGDKVLLYTHHNKNFGLPEDPDVPIIMVGPGTGIAPFRAFVEERLTLGAKGRNWLFFGDQHFNSDFLYQLEWMDYLKQGILTRLDVAFSRDTDHKVYVQHRMMEASREIYAWLQEGACFYVCGDANRMAKDVHQALIDIYAKEGNMAPEGADVAVKELQEERRYLKDVY